MITFFLATAVLVGALFVAVALGHACPGYKTARERSDTVWGVCLIKDRGTNPMPRSASRTPRLPE
jgi:hypothetical protein